MANPPTTDLTSLAVEIAARQDRGQFDKQGEPYILHPLRVMAGVTRAWKHMHPTLRQTLEGVGVTVNDLRAIAVMHDVLEDRRASPRSVLFTSLDSGSRTGFVLVISQYRSHCLRESDRDV